MKHLNSPLSEGKFQFDLWGTEPITSVNDLELNWQSLKEEIMFIMEFIIHYY